MDEKEQVKNRLSYYASWSILKEMYKKGQFDIEVLESVNELNAKHWKCDVKKIKE